MLISITFGPRRAASGQAVRTRSSLRGETWERRNDDQDDGRDDSDPDPHPFSSDEGHRTPLRSSRSSASTAVPRKWYCNQAAIARNRGSSPEAAGMGAGHLCGHGLTPRQASRILGRGVDVRDGGSLAQGVSFPQEVPSPDSMSSGERLPPMLAVGG